MEWINDQITIEFLNEHLPEDFTVFQNYADQFGGRVLNPQNWLDRVINQDLILNYNNSSPANIIECFRNDNMLEGLVLVVSWGTMWRRNNQIYHYPLNVIQGSLLNAKQSIIDTDSINQAWYILTNELNWGNVLMSKALHFICRSIDIEVDPPVPIDNAVFLNKVWPSLMLNVPRNHRPQNWRNGLEGYLRYMTFINYLRENIYQDWNNTNIENTLFSVFQQV